MQINSLSILNFKNIHDAELSFSPSLNCFVGNNGVGKTNFLDAIYYMAFCKSHTNTQDSQNIMHNCDFFMIKCEGLSSGTPVVASCGVKRRQRKVFKYDNKEYDRLSEHIGKIPLVLISPSDEELIREGSDERRKFMDMVITQYDREYMEALVSYNHALMQRNSLLKDEFVNDNSLFEVYEGKMGIESENIFCKRKKFIEEFTPVFEHYYRIISGGKENISLSYYSHIDEGDLENQLKKARQRDTLLGYTTRGIHKDDLQMDLDGFPVKRIGSQGQNKSFLVAVKMAQYAFLKKITGKNPILLIDDLFDKLDSNRVENIIKLVSGNDFGQIFITDTNKDHLLRLFESSGGEYKLFNINDGNIIADRK